MQQDHSTAALILAAGSSSRMGGGRHKLLLPLGERPVLAHVLAAALASRARPIILVLGHQAARVRTALGPLTNQPALTIVENPNYLQGMSTSIQAGLQALISNTIWSSDSAIILLGDQPLITTQIIDTVIATREATRQRIVTPLYQGRRGNPILFDASLFAELYQVAGDEGGKSVIERHHREVAGIEVGASISTSDVDTWEAYQQVLSEWQQAQKGE